MSPSSGRVMTRGVAWGPRGSYVGLDAQRRDADLAWRGLAAFGNHRAVAEEAHLDAVALDDRRLARFVEIAAGAGHRNPFLEQQRARVEQRVRAVVVHVIVGDRHRVEAAVGEDLRHPGRLAAVRLAVTLGPGVGAAIRILALAVGEAQVDALQRRAARARCSARSESRPPARAPGRSRRCR